MDPINFLPESDYEILIELWSTRFPQLINLPEVWAPISSSLYNDIIDGCYSISTYGRCINNYTGYELKQHEGGSGYFRFHLFTKSGKAKFYLAHRIVLMTFKPIENMYSLQVNHKDENKSHNWLWNLEWMTPSENRYYSINTGTIKTGDLHPLTNFSYEKADKVGYLLSNTNLSNAEIISMIDGCTMGILNGIRTGDCWKQIYYKYDLKNLDRRRHIYDEGFIHQICKVIGDNHFYGQHFNRKEISKVYDFIFERCGMEYNSKNIELVYRILNKKSFKQISDKYF